MHGPGALATGEIKEYPPLVPFDAALERVISNVAMDHHRPFSFEAPLVDVQLAPHLRFHGQGFDVVSRPAIFIRVHRVLGATIHEMVAGGSMSAGLGYFLQTVVPEARLRVAFTGVQGSGKTTLLRAALLAYPDTTRMVTVETDFELGMVGLGRRWTGVRDASHRRTRWRASSGPGRSTPDRWSDADETDEHGLDEGEIVCALHDTREPSRVVVVERGREPVGGDEDVDVGQDQRGPSASRAAHTWSRSSRSTSGCPCRSPKAGKTMSSCVS